LSAATPLDSPRRHDLMGVNPQATKSTAGMRGSQSLRSDSRAVGRRDQLRAAAPGHPAGPRSLRHRHSRQIDIPEVSHRAMLVLVHQLAEQVVQLTVLNFANDTSQDGALRATPPGATVTDAFTVAKLPPSIPTQLRRRHGAPPWNVSNRRAVRGRLTVAGSW